MHWQRLVLISSWSPDVSTLYMNDSPRLSKNEVILRSFELFSILLPQISILSRQNCLYLLRNVYSFFKTSFSVRCYSTETQLRPITTNQCVSEVRNTRQSSGDSSFNDSDSDSSRPFRFRLRFQSSWLRFRLRSDSNTIFINDSDSIPTPALLIFLFWLQNYINSDLNILPQIYVCMYIK